MRTKGFWPYPEDKVASFFQAPKEEKNQNVYKDTVPILEG